MGGWGLGGARLPVQPGDDLGWVSFGCTVSQPRTHNPVHEITDIAASVGTVWADPVHDRAGHMTTIPKPSSLANSLTCQWDAWHRLAEINDGATVVARYDNDGRHRRVKTHVDSQSPGSPNAIDAFVHVLAGKATPSE